jgi:glycosyltransferase involved in cell wall biosynthesis
MDAGDDVLVISGEPVEPPLVVSSESGSAGREIPVAVVDGLTYDRFREPADPSVPLSPAGQALADGILAAMTGLWGEAADILHVHNPLIRKTAALLPALNILNKRGIRLLLQNHDLAEDFRPDVYVDGEDYPANCHYAVINSRDYSFLHRAGLKSEGLHLLPNEVSPISASPDPARNRYLYPVRAIRRKNIGEALLLSMFIPPGRTIAVTLPPTTQRDDLIYRRWAALAEELKLPMEFEVGNRETFSRLFGSSLAVITTSVKEGFGFSFLEPWTAGREVIGRRISYVCKDFEDEGIRFNALYSALRVPTVYFSPSQLRQKMERTMNTIYDSFGLELPDYITKMISAEFLSQELFDFGRLDEELQERIIRTLVPNQAVRRDIVEVNPFLQGLADWQPDPELIEANRRIVGEVYGRARINRILQETYRSVMDTPVVHRLSKSVLLELYLDPLRLSLIGVGHA